MLVVVFRVEDLGSTIYSYKKKLLISYLSKTIVQKEETLTNTP